MAIPTETINGAQGCLPDETIRNYLRGVTADLQSFEIEMHMASCSCCEQLAHQVDAKEDSLVGLLAGIESANVDKPPEKLLELMAKVEQLFAEDARPSTQKSTLIGKVVGPYELLEPLGEGGMGIVFRARHRLLGKLFAVKILPGGDSLSKGAFERFRREIAASGRLNHAAIIAATDAGEHEGLHYLAMEVVDGLNLSSISRRLGPLEIADACELMRQAALGLSHAHALGVIHRDIKPSNLMLDVNGNVKILDFGLAQLNAWNDPTSELTTVGQLLGTLDYMAPEQADRGVNVDHRADLYSLGATLYTLLCGRAPFAATPRQSPLEKLRLMATESPPNIQTLRPEVPVELAKTVHRAIARHPEDRPSSAALVAESLAPFAANSDLVALIKRATATADTALHNQSASAWSALAAASFAASKPPRRRIGMWAALIGVLSLAAALGIWIVIETSKGQLIIETDSADVHVKLLSDGKEYDQLQLEPGATATRLFAGKYEIVIDAPSDQYTIDRDTISLRRGETVVAKITTKKPAQMPRPDVGNESIGRSRGNKPYLPPKPIANETVTYNGKTLNEWLNVFQTEQNVKTIRECTESILQLVNEDNNAAVREIVLGYFIGQPDLPVVVRSMALEEASVQAFCYRQRLLAELGINPESFDRLIPLLPVDGNSSPAAIHKSGWAAGALNRLLPRHSDTVYQGTSLFSWTQSVGKGLDVPIDSELARLYGSAALAGWYRLKNEDVDATQFVSVNDLLKDWKTLGPEFWLVDAFGSAGPNESQVIQHAVEQIKNPNAPIHLRWLACQSIECADGTGTFLPQELVGIIAEALAAAPTEAKFLALENADYALMNNKTSFFPSQVVWPTTTYTSLSIASKSQIFRSRDLDTIWKYGKGFHKRNFILELLGLCEACANQLSEPGVLEGLKKIRAATESGNQRFFERRSPTSVAGGKPKNVYCTVDFNAMTVRMSGLDQNEIPFDDFMAYVIHGYAAKVEAKIRSKTAGGQVSSNQANQSAPEAEHNGAARLPQSLASNKSTYNGKTLEQWLNTFLYEQNVTNVEESVAAIASMTVESERAQILKVVFDVLLSQPDESFARKPDEAFAMKTTRFNRLTLFSRIPIDANTANRLLTALDVAAPNKSDWILSAVTTTGTIAAAEPEQLEKVLSAIRQLLDNPNVTTDDFIAGSCGDTLFRIIRLVNPHEKMLKVRDHASQLLAESNKLGTGFWINAWPTAEFPKAVETKLFAILLGVIRDANSTNEMLGIACLRLRTETQFTEDLSVALDNALARIAANQQLRAISQVNFDRALTDRDLNYIKGTLHRYVPPTLQLEFDDIRPTSANELSPFNATLELLATFRPSEDSVDVPRGTNGLKTILVATEGEFMSCVEALRSYQGRQAISISLRDFTMKGAKDRPLNLTRTQVLGCIIHACARAIERQITDRVFDPKVAYDVYALLGKYDADFDDALSADEVQSMEKAPTGADSDGDGILSRRELLEFFSAQQKPKDESDGKDPSK